MADGADVGVPWIAPRPVVPPAEPHLVIADHWICSLKGGGEHDAPATFSERLAQAVRDLERRSSTSGFTRLRGDLYCSAFGDHLDASRVLLPGLLGALDIEGAPIVALVDRDTLLVCGDRDEKALSRLVDMLPERLAQSPLPMTGRLLRWEGTWSAYVPPPSSSSRRAARAMAQMQSSLDYAFQAEVFRDLLGEATIFADHHAKRTATGRVVTSCTWAVGVSQLLPEADQIRFVGRASRNPAVRDHIVVNWDDALPIVGELMTRRDDLYPVRYAVDEFPSALAMEALRRLPPQRPAD